MLSDRIKKIIIGIVITCAAIGLAWGLPVLLGEDLSWYLLTALLLGLLIWIFWVMWSAWRKLRRHEATRERVP